MIGLGDEGLVGNSGKYQIRTVPDLQGAITHAETSVDRKEIYERAAFLGLLSKLPNNWNADGTLQSETSDQL